MIKIKKLSKINELFSVDGSNIFDYDEIDDETYEFFANNETYEVFTQLVEEYGLVGRNISYGIQQSGSDKTNFKPERNKFTIEKAKIINTVVYIVSEMIKNDDIEDIQFLTFSGNNENGLGDFYKILIKSLKLNEKYFIQESNILGEKTFVLINKDFDMKENGPGDITFEDNKKIITSELYGSQLSFKTVLNYNKQPCQKLTKIINYIVSTNNDLTNINGINGDDFSIVWDSFIEVTDAQVKEIIEIMKNQNFEFVRRSGNSMTFYFRQ